MIRRFLFAGAAAGVSLWAGALAANAQEAVQAQLFDPIGELIADVIPQRPATDLRLKATLYHSGAGGVGTRDSLGCRVVAMRTLATDPKVIPRRSVVYIEETVGMRLPDGSEHDGIWYASDTGGAIRGQKIDLYTGDGRSSMQPFMERGLNLATLNAATVGSFEGCPLPSGQYASNR